eukprot:5628606-Lingulodinium_polyedra.AAC.1
MHPMWRPPGGHYARATISRQRWAWLSPGLSPEPIAAMPCNKPATEPSGGAGVAPGGRLQEPPPRG